MKKTLRILGILLLSLSMMAISAVPALAAKPTGNLASAQQVAWNLSGAVMPFPWGQHDITGSDTASKLIVNQPQGTTQVAITGAMNGLNPDTTYTVYISKGHANGWNVAGTWNFDLVSTKFPGTYLKTMTISQDANGHLTGTGGNVPSGYTWSVVGDVTGNNVAFQLTYIEAPLTGYVASFVGVINANGTMQGTWSDIAYGDSGPWASTSGQAVGYPGPFNGLPTFTFTTDSYGAGSWHINLTDANLPGTLGDKSDISVWINDNSIPATILISDNFTVTKG